MSLADADFDYVRKLVLDHSAIVLSDSKKYLVESRLTPLARDVGVDSIGDLVGKLQGQPFGESHRQVVDAMTTNETSFFRDFHPFEALKNEVIPRLMDEREVEKKLHIWCAACSSGQEPYSLAMLLRESFPALRDWTVSIIATDISEEMVAKAKAGVYSQLEVNRGLPAPLLIKYFQKAGTDWQIKEELRSMIEFRQMNLVDRWPPMPQPDIVLIRNVLIYFDVEIKRQILGEIRSRMKKDGALFLGGAETTINVDDAFQRVQNGQAGYYQLKP